MTENERKTIRACLWYDKDMGGYFCVKEPQKLTKLLRRRSP